MAKHEVNVQTVNPQDTQEKEISTQTGQLITRKVQRASKKKDYVKWGKNYRGEHKRELDEKEDV
jgi:hypothetical protein|tara:strand:- start:472 stop:663 length:192 start_codon:yes stop_codon:yes gene_type:complete